ncbi:MAG: protein-export chaperone SecB [Streptococcus minor]|nr:protein-export chaperone SecB [Streptococcus minor]
MNKPVISLEKYEVDEINFSRSLTKDDLENSEVFDVSFGGGFSEDKQNGKVTISVTCIDKETLRKVKVTVSGYFLINDTENIEEFLIVNGSAIIFPYVRSILSMVTSFDSETALLIPTVNILDLMKNKSDY